MPAVNIGTRQQGREHGENVIYVDYDAAQIVAAINRQMSHGRYKSAHLFGDGTAGRKIAEVLASVEPNVQKRLRYGPSKDREIQLLPDRAHA